MFIEKQSFIAREFSSVGESTKKTFLLKDALTCMELHDSLCSIAVRVVDVRQLHVVIDSIVHLENVNLSFGGKQNCSDIGMEAKH